MHEYIIPRNRIHCQRNIRASVFPKGQKKSAELRTFDFIGDPGVIRTRDLRIRSPALYPAELRGHAYNIRQEYTNSFLQNH